MRCDECLPMLDQFVEGEFDDETTESLSAHLAACSACASAHETLQREQEIYASYLFDVEPSPALWAGLQLQLEKNKAISTSQPQLRLQRWLAIAFGRSPVTAQPAAALVFIAIGLAIGIMVWRRNVDVLTQPARNSAVVVVPPSWQVNRGGTPRESDNAGRLSSANDNDRQAQPSSTESGDRGGRIHVSAARSDGHNNGRSRAVSSVDQVAWRAERQYLSAIEILSRDIKRRRAFISPGLVSQLEKVLVEVDRNIAATRKVARERPRDPFAVQYLALAYEEKVELLREVTSR